MSSYLNHNELSSKFELSCNIFKTKHGNGAVFFSFIVDFFSLGVMIYRFLCGKKPFQSKRSRDRRRNENRQENRDVISTKEDPQIDKNSLLSFVTCLLMLGKKSS